MENDKKLENIRASKRKYGTVYNKTHVTVQLNRDLIDRLKSKIGDSNTVKSFIEGLIEKSL